MIARFRPDRRPIDHPRSYGFAVSIFLACGIWGCSGNGVEAVDVSEARQALRTTTETWKSGGPIASLNDQKPPIVAQYLDWESGDTLVKFDLLDDGKDNSVSLQIPVELTLQAKTGKEVKKKVKYMVGTSPVITVFREIF